MTMQIFARRAPAMTPPDEPALLLEGSWLRGDSRAGRWSLDDSIDARFAWIDRWASEQAARLADGQLAIYAATGDAAGMAYLNELALRYFLVKLARVVAFFDEVRSPKRGETWQLHLTRDDDAVYAELFGSLAERHGVNLVVHRSGSPGTGGPSSMTAFADANEANSAERRAGRFPWRLWAARAAGLFAPRLSPPGARPPRVILCGNPRILDPVCAELLDRDCRVWWLYVQFAIRSWWKWRAKGVNQLICDDGAATGAGWAERSESHLPVARRDEVPCGQRWDSLRSAHPTPTLPACHAACLGVSLDGAIACWLSEQAILHGARQAQWLERIGDHFRAAQPTALVLDEDATPFKRAAVAMARNYGARSLVVQHGAPCGPFGFAPLAADQICVWGRSTREQLCEWGIADSRIHITGWPSHSLCRERAAWRSDSGEAAKVAPTLRGRDSSVATGDRNLSSRSAEATLTRRPPRFLLLATVPPDDRRPDTVTFHLTSRTHAQMIDMACAAVSRFAGARLTIKLHPRTRDGRVFQVIARRWRQLDVRLVRSGDFTTLGSEADCILSCVSTAGIEAALAGAPVVQLLPHGSGDVLPADRWGLIGSARTLEELSPLIDRALVRGWCASSERRKKVVVQVGRSAAASVVDRILNTAVAGAEPWRCPGGFGLPGHRQGSAPATFAAQVAIE